MVSSTVDVTPCWLTTFPPNLLLSLLLSSCCFLSPIPHGTFHKQLGCAVWAALVGCVCSPPLLTYSMSSICNSSSFKLFISFCTTPFTSNPVVTSVGDTHGFWFPPACWHLGFISLSWTLWRPASCITSFLALWHSLHLSEYQCMFLFSFSFDPCDGPFLHIRSCCPRNSLGWMSLECFSWPPPPLSPSDTLKPPQVTVGWATFGSHLWHHAHVVGSSDIVAGPAASNEQVLVLAVL